MTLLPDDPTGRVPPGQRVTEKFPVMTAGTPRVTPADHWTLTLARESGDGAVETLALWDMAAFRALPQTVFTVDIHCVTRWSKLDTRWRGVAVADLVAAAGLDWPEAGPKPEGGDIAPEDLPLAYVEAFSDGDYAANLLIDDVAGSGAAACGFVAVDYDAGDGRGLQPLEEAHGGPARLVVPKLYFWKSAKWLRRITLTPFDRKGFWERLGYHNRGDPWSEQRYRGVGAEDWRTTLDPTLSKAIRDERLKR